MLQELRNRGKRKNGEKGFSLVEILVTVAILAILAAIAIPIFLNQRTKALVASTVSDGRTVSQEMTTALQGYTTLGTQAAGVGTITQSAGSTSLTVAALTAAAPRTTGPGTITTSAPSPGNTVSGYIVPGAVSTVPGFCVKVTNTNTAAFAVYTQAGYQSSANGCANTGLAN